MMNLFGFFGDWVDVSSVVEAAHVLAGWYNYSGGSLGTYYPPNNGSSPYTMNPALLVEAAYFGTANADRGTYHEPLTAVGYSAEVKNNVAFGPSSTYYGTFVDYDMYTAGQENQLATDVDAVTAKKAHLDSGYSILGVYGTLNMSLYTLISGVAVADNVRKDVERYSGGPLGGCYVPNWSYVLTGTNVDNTTGTLTLPAVGKVDTTNGNFGVGGQGSTPTLNMALYTAITGVAVQTDVRFGVSCYGGGPTGLAYIPTAANVIEGVDVDATEGTYHEAETTEVEDGVKFGPSSTYEGSYAGGGGIDPKDIVGAAYVLTGHYNYTGGAGGSLTLPAVGKVDTTNGAFGVGGSGSTPTLNMSLYTLISGIVGATYVLTGHDNYTGGAGGSLTLPAVGKVDTTNGDYGVGGGGSTPTLNMSLYTLISGIVDATYVLTGHDNYSGGSGGTLTLPAGGKVDTTAGAFGVGGTGTTPTLDVAAAQAAAAAGQLTTDRAAVGAVAASISDEVQDLLGTVDGELDLDLYTLTSEIPTDEEIAAAAWSYGNRTLT